MPKGNLEYLFCGLLFCLSITALIIACLAFVKKTHIRQPSNNLIGEYKGKYSIGLLGTISVTLTFNSQQEVFCSITIPGGSIPPCRTPEKYHITNGQITFIECLAEQISTNGIKLSSTYSKSDNTIILNITKPLEAQILLYSSTEKRNWPQTCADNSQCNTWCSGKAGTSQDYCCPIGGTLGGHGYWGKDYCDNLPPGTYCKSDAMCKSKNCKDNSSGTGTGKCV